MYRLRLVFVLIFALLSTASFVIAQQLPPYLYYYDNPELAFRVERADGTDSHLLFGEIIDPDEATSRVEGPGWSPDGQWFSWYWGLIDLTYYPQKGYTIRLENSEILRAVEALSWIAFTEWSPDSNFLLVSGGVEPCDGGYCTTRQYWLIDVQQNVLLTTFDFRRGARGIEQAVTPIEWLLEEQQVVFYESEEVLTQPAYNSYRRIIMRFDGTVVEEPISVEAWNAIVTPLESEPEVQSNDIYRDLEFTSPSGRYTITPAAGMLTDTQTGEQVTLPAPDFFEGEFDLRMNAAVWHPSEEWVLLGYNAWSSSGIDAVSVFKVDGSVYRELAECGGIGDACIGWLPENVDVARISQAGE